KHSPPPRRPSPGTAPCIRPPSSEPPSSTSPTPRHSRPPAITPPRVPPSPRRARASSRSRSGCPRPTTRSVSSRASPRMRASWRSLPRGWTRRVRRSRRARGVGRIAARVQFIPVEIAIAVPIDPDARARAGWDAGVRELPAARHDRDQAEQRIRDRRDRLAITGELARTDVEKADLPAEHLALGHQIALAGVGAGDEEIDARPGHGAVRSGERDLLPDDRKHVGVEREDEGLDLTPQEGPCGAGRETAGVDARELVEPAHVDEPEGGIRGAVVQEAEAADLIALVVVVAAIDEGRLRHAEHPDLLVGVAQVGDL